jgi:uncharacterized protein (TIGR02246 family)
MKKILFFALAAASANYANAQSKAGAAESLISIASVVSLVPTQNKDEEAIRGLLINMEIAWNNKNGESFSSVFADVHDYIVLNGMYFPGFTKKGNAAAHQGLFNSIYKTYDIKLKVDKISFLRPDLAQVTILGAGYTKGEAVPQDPTIIMTVIAEKKEDAWKIISFHNHELNKEEIKQRSPMPLNVMYASWYK